MTTSSSGKLHFDVWDGSIEPLVPREGSTFEYDISSAAQLAGLAAQGTYPASNTYTLTTNIDLNEIEWTPIGGNVSARFEGTFDGDGHTITGLNLADNQTRTGLFGYLGPVAGTWTVVENLTVELSDNGGFINNTTVSNAGALAGEIANTQLDNISVKGELNIKSSVTTLRVGGISGLLGNAQIFNSVSNVNVKCETTHASGEAQAGGLAGYSSASSARISSCYSTGNVTAIGVSGATAGGITGYNSPTITSCYTTGNIHANAGNANAGGIAGMNTSAPIQASYAHGDVKATATGTANSGGIVGNLSSGTIERCAALNNNISGAGSKTARIAGNLAGTATNNAANIDMLVNSSIVINSNKDGFGINPALLTESIYTGTGTLTETSGVITGGLGWDSNVWDFTSRYPKLIQ